MNIKLACAVLGAASLAACSTNNVQPLADGPPTLETAEKADAATLIADFMLNVGDRVHFGFDQYALTEKARAGLAAQAEWLDANPDFNIVVAGNCDERGTREYNLALGARRAQAAKDYLIALGVAPARITTISNGKEKPVDTAQTEAAWAKNRNTQTIIRDGATS